MTAVPQSPCGLRNFSPNNTSFPRSVSDGFFGLRFGIARSAIAFRDYRILGLKSTCKRPSFQRLGTVCAYNKPTSDANLNHLSGNITGIDGVEPFRGKSGSISFVGVTHQMVEEANLVSAPFENSRSLLWVLGPVAFISSLLLPQFVGIVVDGFIKDEILSGIYHAEIVASLTSEIMFYIGFAIYLLVTDFVQKPYLQFSSKRWGLITGLRGYLTSAFLTSGLKVFAPLFAVYVTWPLLGLPALVSVAPFLASIVVQFLFERALDKRRSSSWPLVPIVFEFYRLYQLSKAAHFIEKLMFSMRGLPSSPEVMERSGALVSMIVTFQFVGLVCLWSLTTFLLRLFPSRPVAENY